ncbi:MAG: hypothetical protein WC858_01785 [Parcubacteria group bacterium]|jgi:hypothetical protein
MPEVIEDGILTHALFPDLPPAGLVEKCPNCLAKLKTQLNEKGVKKAVFFDKSQNIKLPAWKIACPQCGRLVTFVWEKPPTELYAFFNNHKDK